MLLNDVRILENIEIISESKSPQGMKIRGLFQRADEENNNKRVYPKTVLESQVKGLQDMIKENRLCGELDHPSHDIVKLSNASHLITGLYMEGNDVIGEAKVLDTPAGKVAQALIEGGVKIGISSRGVGTLSEDTMRKVKYVNDDYKLVTFDLVADPSTRGAFPALSESTESGEKTRKIVNDTYKKALGEKVFVTMLKESFNTSLQETDKPYEKEDTSYEEVMKMRGYPSVDDVLSRGNVKEDPFYKVMMAAVKGATPVKAKESVKAKKSKKKKKVDSGTKKKVNDSTKPTYDRIIDILSEDVRKRRAASSMYNPVAALAQRDFKKMRTRELAKRHIEDPVASKTQTPKPSQPTPARPTSLADRLGAFGGRVVGPLSRAKRGFATAWNWERERSGGSPGGSTEMKPGKPPGKTIWGPRYGAEQQILSKQLERDAEQQRKKIQQARPDKSNVASLNVTSNTQPTYNKMAEFLEEAYIYKK